MDSKGAMQDMGRDDMRLVRIRVCLDSGLAVRMIPGDRCLAHGTAPTMCRTAVREMLAMDATALQARSRSPDTLQEAHG